MNLGKMVLCSLGLVCSVYGFGYGQNEQPCADINSQLELLSSGDISEENKEIFRQVTQKLGVKDLVIHVKQPTSEFRLVQPASAFLFALPAQTCSYLFVSEAWFDNLTKDEKFFAAGLAVQVIADSISNLNTLQNFSSFFTAVQFAAPIGIITGIKPLKLGWKKNTAIVAGGTVSLLLTILGAYILYQKNKIRNDLEKRVLHVAHKLDLLDAAISYYEKFKAEVISHLQDDPEYWKPLVAVIEKALLPLKKEKSAKLA